MFLGKKSHVFTKKVSCLYEKSHVYTKKSLMFIRKSLMFIWKKSHVFSRKVRSPCKEHKLPPRREDAGPPPCRTRWSKRCTRPQFWGTRYEQHSSAPLQQKNIKLDVDPQRDDDASPMSIYRCMLRPTWMISALQHKSKYKSNSISNFFEKKIKFFGSHVVVLVKTFPLMYQLLM